MVVTEAGCSGGTRTYLLSLLEFLYNGKFAVTVLINGHSQDFELQEIIKKYSFDTLHVNFDFWCTDFDNIPRGLSKKQLNKYQANEILFWIGIQQKHRFAGIIFNVAYPEMFLYAFLLPVKIKYILHSVPGKKADSRKKFLLNYALSNRKEILTVSQFACSAISVMWCDKKDSKYIHFVHNHYEPGDSDRSEVQDIDILTIGNVVDYKNPQLFLNLAKAINMQSSIPVYFVWAGDGAKLDEFRGATENIPYVKFIGHKKHVDGLYKKTKIYLQPSLMESHGIAVLGAMFNKIPCVVSDRGGLRESCIDGKTGFVVPVTEEDTFIERINFLLQNRQRSKQMGLDGRKYFNEKFSKAVWTNLMSKEFKNFLYN